MMCCICYRAIERQPLTGWSVGHSAEPVKIGRCCDSCHYGVVIPQRMRQMGESKMDEQ